MQIIDHRQFKSKQPTRRNKRLLAGKIVLGIVGLFIIANLVMGVLYRNKVLPGYTLGKMNVAGFSYDKVEQLQSEEIIPQELTLIKNEMSKQVVTQDMGVSVDDAKSIAALKKARMGLPVLSLVTKHAVAAHVAVDDTQLRAKMTEISAEFEKSPLEKRVAFNGREFYAAPSEDGYRVNLANLNDSLGRDVAQGKKTITVPTDVIPPSNLAFDTAQVTVLNKQLDTPLSFMSGSQKIQPTKEAKGAWYIAQGQTMTPSAAKISEYLQSVASGQGAQLANTADLGLAARYALLKQKPYAYRMSFAGESTKRTYCTATKGVGDANMDDFIGKIAATYADTRGWNADGAIAFEHVSSGCGYTVWLSQPASMTSFGSICDDYYNCQVGANVIVNSDRWEKATDAWNATGGSLEDYRTLIIDHETGHRLGFPDNPVCPVPGGLAPVMMQQSMALNGCVFNIWPTVPELAQLREML